MMNSMPTDIVLEIFSRLPAKSVGMCCCVSKLWASILNSQDFRELFLTRSSSRPRLLLAIGDYTYKFFSSPQPHYSLDKSSHHVVTADSYMKYLEDMHLCFCSYTSGLMCCRQNNFNPMENNLYVVHVICNPSTGHHVLLPKLILNIRHYASFSSLGFDPVDRQFKVLLTVYKDKRIITLGTGEMRWRKIQCSLAHQVENMHEGICISGILYYLGFTSDSWDSRILVCFDVRSEKFNFIEEKEVVECFDGLLFNYKGKLGGARTNYVGKTLQLRMWVLEDFAKQKLSEYVYNLPENEFVRSHVSVAGTTARGEIVLISDYKYLPLYVFYFNPESNTLQSIEFQGLRNVRIPSIEFQGLRNVRIKDVKVFVDYVEGPRFDFLKATSLPERKLKQTSSTSTYAATSTSPTEQKTKLTGTSTSSKARLQQERGKFESINKFDALCLLDNVEDLRSDVVKTNLPEQKPEQTSTSSKVDHSVKLRPINGDVSFGRPMRMHVAVSSNVFFENLPKAWLIYMLIGLGVALFCSLLHILVQP